MKTRVTFRVADELAAALRDLPNQTQFVEAALREALQMICPVCDGSGLVAARPMRVQDFRAAGLAPIRGATAVQLKAIVRLARTLAATKVDLSRAKGHAEIAFSVRRGRRTLMSGQVADGRTLMLTH